MLAAASPGHVQIACSKDWLKGQLLNGGDLLEGHECDGFVTSPLP